jgi:hypothetical protein
MAVSQASCKNRAGAGLDRITLWLCLLFGRRRGAALPANIRRHSFETTAARIAAERSIPATASNAADLADLGRAKYVRAAGPAGGSFGAWAANADRN